MAQAFQHCKMQNAVLHQTSSTEHKKAELTLKLNK